MPSIRLNNGGEAHLITFGGAAYDHQVSKTVDQCARQGIACHVYDDRWLSKQAWYAHNLWIFQREPQHGFGFCSWKPFIIRHALERVKDGDVVMYLDGDTYPVADFGMLFEMAAAAPDGVVLFEEQGCVNKTWIRRECFEAHNAWDDVHREAMIACGRFQLFRKPSPPAFLSLWEQYSLDKRCQFHHGGPGDDPSFVKSSCEQAVLSILAVDYGIPLHRTPDQNGWPVAHNGTYKPEDKYPQLFFQDGNRGNLRDWSGSKFANVAP